jgi:hypothetical protein
MLPGGFLDMVDSWFRGLRLQGARIAADPQPAQDDGSAIACPSEPYGTEWRLINTSFLVPFVVSFVYPVAAVLDGKYDPGCRSRAPGEICIHYEQAMATWWGFQR